MISKLEFILFYTIFILFVIQVSGMAGQRILSDTPAFADVPIDSGTILNPLVNLNFWIGLLTISSEYQIIFTIILLPFIIGLVWVFIETVRGI